MNTNKYIDICRAIIGETDSATDFEIDNAINLAEKVYPEIPKDIVKRQLLACYTLPILPYKTLLNSNNPGGGWFSANNFALKESISWNFWERYRRYLIEKERYQPGVIYQLDQLTNDILDNLFNPTIKDTIMSKKGLVVGQVQSGKTSNFIGLICKAVDAGFNVVIVFAGLLDDLRTQTQSRLEKCFLGFTTKDIKKIYNNEKIGVGLIDPNPLAHAFTTVVSDFKEATINSLGVNFQTKDPILFVVKKNGRILENLRKWLSTKNLSTKSVLFIDDEADNASVNTSKNKDKASTINRKIREILSLFHHNAYIGYTATPYANIFIDRDNENDLFPRNFIVNLPTPPAYLSPEKVFGLDNEDDHPLPIVNVVNDYTTFVPDKHKKDDIDYLKYRNLPESLKYAIRCFIISCAVRIARGQGNKHNSMLIHLSRYQVWQNKIKDLIKRCFNFYKNEIMADDPDIYAQLKKDFEECFICGTGIKRREFQSYVHTTDEILCSEHKVLKSGITRMDWDEVKPHLYNVVTKIEVKALNGASEDILAYEDHAEDGLYVIAIGGDKLSRGLTLEGLTISYFLRASKMYDTLMQMGRWFGYRNGYVDLCRLFISEEINHWYKNITLANNELREEFDYLWESKGSPQQYAMKVRKSPGLLITSPLKMFSTKDIQISWASTLVETYSLNRDEESRSHNFALTDKFIRDLGSRYQRNGIDDPRGFLWVNIGSDLICNFITNFKIADTSRIKMDFERMSDYIKSCVHQYGELTNWRVLVRNNQETNKSTADTSDRVEYSFCDGVIRGLCTNRTRVGIPDQDDYVYNLKNYHLISGPKDEFIDIEILGESDSYLSPALIETQNIKRELHSRNPNVKEWNESYPSPTLVRQKYRPSDMPLLIIYPLNPVKANILDSRNQLKEGISQYKCSDLPFIAFAIVFPSSSNSSGVTYVVNEVKDLIETEINFESENDNTYPDE